MKGACSYMEKNTSTVVYDQLKNIILNRPIEKINHSEGDEEFAKTQEAMCYLSDCLKEFNDCLANINKGKLDVQNVTRHNFLASGLKELNSIMRNIVWQAEQVASGDYNQRMDYLGDFSESFNAMAQQLQEREDRLKEQADALSQSMSLLQGIIDANSNWVLVTEAETGDILYRNRAVSEYFVDNPFKAEDCIVIRDDFVTDHHTRTIKYSTASEKYYCVDSYKIQWDNKKATVHFVENITSSELHHKNLVEIAYLDELTGTFNRRYCMDKIQELMDKPMAFCLGMIDLNGLKFVNDNLGHLEGDNYLTAVVTAISESLRESDVVCRVGGDEFIVLLVGCPEEAAVMKLNMVNDILKKADSTNYHMSMSFGVLEVSKYTKYTREEILELSDQKMYDSLL